MEFTSFRRTSSTSCTNPAHSPSFPPPSASPPRATPSPPSALTTTTGATSAAPSTSSKPQATSPPASTPTHSPSRPVHRRYQMPCLRLLSPSHKHSVPRLCDFFLSQVRETTKPLHPSGSPVTDD